MGVPPNDFSEQGPVTPMPDMPDNLPGSGFLGWLGRQVGHIAKAVKADVIPPSASPDSKIVYRDCTIEEMVSPVDPNVKLRRTVIDEVIKEVQSAECKMQNEEKSSSD